MNNAKWRALSEQFLSLADLDFHGDLKAERIGRNSAFHLTGATAQIRREFESAAEEAGTEILGVREITMEIAQLSDPVQRWYAALMTMTQAFREPRLQWESEDAESRAVIYVGFIDRPAHASHALCTRFAEARPQPEITPVRTQTTSPKRSAKLGQKAIDLSQYYSNVLTDRQRECFSMKMEYGLSVVEIAKRLGISRPTVMEHIAAAAKRIENAQTASKQHRGIRTQPKPPKS
jgi:predicted DNA-binding protein YlxM (UPF0122 family)